MSAPSRFPLVWPKGRPRTKDRRRGDFSMTVEGGKARRVNMATAAERLEDQITRLGGVYAILSTNVELRMDGRPRADRAAPADPGACVYFQLKGEPYAMACDTFDSVEQNIAALAAHIEATRRIERYGVATAAETLQAFSALPPPKPGTGVIELPQAQPSKPWWAVLGIERRAADEETVNAVYRVRVRGASEAQLLDLNLARDAALAAIKGRS